MNWKRLEHEFTAACCVIFGAAWIGYWGCYYSGSNDGVFTVTPATAGSFCWISFCAITARVVFRMLTVPDDQGM